MSDIAEIKRRAGIKESEDPQFELHVYNSGNSRPFVSVGDGYALVEELTDMLQYGDGNFAKIEIIPKSS